MDFLGRPIVRWSLALLLLAIFWLKMGPLAGCLFMLNLYVHEYGHVWAMRRRGLKVEGIAFVPFLGGIAMSADQPKSRDEEAFIAIMGPIWGTAMALVTFVTGRIFQLPVLVGAAYSMAGLNLFNLLPIGSLDGGRIWKSSVYSFEPKVRATLMIVGGIFAVVTMWFVGGTAILAILLLCTIIPIVHLMRQNPTVLRRHELSMCIAEVLHVPPKEADVNGALNQFAASLATDDPLAITQHPIFTVEPFAGRVKSLTAAEPNQDFGTWTPEKWREIYHQAFDDAMEKTMDPAPDPLTLREVLHYVELFFVHGGRSNLVPLPTSSAWKLLGLYVGLIIFLLAIIFLTPVVYGMVRGG